MACMINTIIWFGGFCQKKTFTFFSFTDFCCHSHMKTGLVEQKGMKIKVCLHIFKTWGMDTILLGAVEHHLTFPETVLSDSNLATRQRKQTELEAEPRWLNLNFTWEKSRWLLQYRILLTNWFNIIWKHEKSKNKLEKIKAIYIWYSEYSEQFNENKVKIIIK